MKNESEFLEELHHLNGLECWGVVAGEGTGSRITLDFGKNIPRARPLKNPKLSEMQRQHKGEFGLFVQNCAWRLGSETVICSSKSPNSSDGPMVRGLQSVVGQHVVNVAVTSPGYDLVVHFSGGARLHLFCDCLDQTRDGNNYSFHTLSRSFVICAGSTIITE